MGRSLDSTSNDFHTHITMVERTPSVITDVPHYPNVHKAFKNMGYNQEELDQSQQQQQSSDKAKKGFVLCKWKTFQAK
ncbi:hypothetical protein SLA2020_039860 [Shorea laevis]